MWQHASRERVTFVHDDVKRARAVRMELRHVRIHASWLDGREIELDALARPYRARV